MVLRALDQVETRIVKSIDDLRSLMGWLDRYEFPLTVRVSPGIEAPVRVAELESAINNIATGIRSDPSNLQRTVYLAATSVERAEKAESRVTELETEQKRLRDALEWYAQARHYDGSEPVTLPDGTDCYVSLVENDEGQRARAALRGEEE